MLIIPAIDLRGGRCVRLIQGDYERELRYELDPVEVAKGYAGAGATLIHVVDLDAARGGSRLNRALVGKIARDAGVAVEVGGGIRSFDDVDEVLGEGARYAVVGTLAAEQPELLPELASCFGDAVVLGLDGKGGEVAVRGWLQGSGLGVDELARLARDAGIVRAIYTDIPRDGTFSGPDIDGAAKIEAATGLRVTASGGVGSLEHVEAAKAVKLHALIAGRALFDGRVGLRAALSIAGPQPEIEAR